MTEIKQAINTRMYNMLDELRILKLELENVKDTELLLTFTNSLAVLEIETLRSYMRLHNK